MYICETMNINETTRLLVLMVTQVGCDALIDLEGVEFLFPHTFSSKVSLRVGFTACASKTSNACVNSSSLAAWIHT